MEHRLSSKFQLRVEAVRYLRQGETSSNESAIIKLLQESETQPAYFAMRVGHEENDSAFIWEPSDNAFVKYTKTSQGFERRGDRYPPKVAKWDVISWITKEGMEQLCAYPEFLAIDETYKVSAGSRALYQASGIRGDYKTFTCFRSLIQESSSEDIVRWIFNVSWPLLVQKFSPHPSVLSAIEVITIDGGLVQDAVLRSVHVFPNAQIRFCYWHEIKKPFQEEILRCCKSSQLPALKSIQDVLKYIFFSCENKKERMIVQQHLKNLVHSSLSSPAFQTKVWNFCYGKISKWIDRIGKVFLLLYNSVMLHDLPLFRQLYDEPCGGRK